jgi:hypothetical protein
MEVFSKVHFRVITELVVSNSDRLPQMDLAYDPGKGYSGISELMRAIILRTIEDLQQGGELREEALTYICDDSGDDEESEDYVFSFPAICRYLGLDPQKTRDAILNAKTRIKTRRRAA